MAKMGIQRWKPVEVNSFFNAGAATEQLLTIKAAEED